MSNLLVILCALFMFFAASCKRPVAQNSLSGNDKSQFLFPIYQYTNADIDHKMGYINSAGKIAIKPFFSRAEPFSEGLASVMIGGKWGFIDKTGKIVIKARFDEAAPFSEGMAVVEINGKCDYIDKAGNLLNFKIDIYRDGQQSCPYLARPFSEGLAAVYVGGTCEDRNSGTRRRCQAHDMNAQSGGKWAFINKQGHIIIKPQFDGAYSFSEGLASVLVGAGIDGSRGYINKSGAFVIRPQFNFAFPFSEGLAAVCIGKGIGCSNWGYINKTGSFAIKPQFGAADSFSEGMAAFQDSNSNWGYIDKTGRAVIRPKSNIQYAHSFSEGMAAFHDKNDKCGYLDKSGNIAISPRFLIHDDSPCAYPFKNGLASAQDGLRVGYINKEGKFVFASRMDRSE